MGNKNILQTCFLPALLIGWLTISTAHAQPVKDRSDAMDFLHRMGRGANFMASKIDAHYQSAYDFKLLAENHFTHCRIGGKLDLHIGAAPEFRINPESMNGLKEAVDLCLEQNLVAVLDPLHTFNKSYYDDQLPVVKSIWRQVSEAFKDYPTTMLAFEIMNEPHADYDLKKLVSESLAAIRSVAGNEKRIVVISGQGFSTRQALINAFNDNIFPGNDPFLIATFHYYDPRPFTNQGSSGNTVHWGEGGDYDLAWKLIKDAFDEVSIVNSYWAKRNETVPLPVYLGEYGVDQLAPDEDKMKWLSWVQMVAEKKGFSAAVWSMYSTLQGKGLGPWENEQKKDPAKRYFRKELVKVILTQNGIGLATVTGGLQITQSRGGWDNNQVVDFSNAEINDEVVIPDGYIPKTDTFNIVISYKNEENKPARIEMEILDEFNRIISSVPEIELLPTSNVDSWSTHTIKCFITGGNNRQFRLRCKRQGEKLLLNNLDVTIGAKTDDENVVSVETDITDIQIRNIRIFPTIFCRQTNVYLNNNFLYMQYRICDMSGTLREEGKLYHSVTSIGEKLSTGYYIVAFKGANVYQGPIRILKIGNL